MTKNSYFMRVICRDEDKLNPIFIKIPMEVLPPSPNMLKLLVALENFYGVECYLAIPGIEELPDGQISITLFGVATSEAMLITTRIDGMQVLCGITSVSGEYDLLAISKDRYLETLIADQDLANYLGLEYIEELTTLHHKCLESID